MLIYVAFLHHWCQFFLLQPEILSWCVSSAWLMTWFQASVGCMAADVHDIRISNTFVVRLGIATIVAIEGGPEHGPLLFRVLSALESAGNCALVHPSHEVLELIAGDGAVSVTVDHVPRIVDLLLEGFSVSLAALLFVGDAQSCLERFFCLLLGISESFLPFPEVFLKWREESLLTLDFLRCEKIGAVPGFALLSLCWGFCLVLLGGGRIGGGLLLLLLGGGLLLLLLGGGLHFFGGWLCLCGFSFSHIVYLVVIFIFITK